MKTSKLNFATSFFAAFVMAFTFTSCSDDFDPLSEAKDQLQNEQDAGNDAMFNREAKHTASNCSNLETLNLVSRGQVWGSATVSNSRESLDIALMGFLPIVRYTIGVGTTSQNGINIDGTVAFDQIEYHKAIIENPSSMTNVSIAQAASEECQAMTIQVEMAFVDGSGNILFSTQTKASGNDMLDDFFFLHCSTMCNDE